MASTEIQPAAAATTTTTARRALFPPWYAKYVLGVLFLGYVVNAMDRGVLSILLEPIKLTFHASDTELGLLGGIAFALFYSTLGIPIAMLADRTSRRNVLAACVALWSIMTALCGVATTFLALLLARTGTGVGEAGGSPPSHALISDYFPISQRATAFSVYALAIPAGAMLGSFFGGWCNELYGWRATFILIGLPGVLVALLVRFTLREPPRGYADSLANDFAPAAAGAKVAAPPFWDVVRFFNRRPSFWHLCLAAALHSVVWYGGSTFNAVFFIRSHHMSTGEAGSWLALMAAIAGIGTFLGGYLGDRLSVRTHDRRWYLWVPGIGAIIMVPLQALAYLAGDLRIVLPTFGLLIVLASLFFGPSFAMTQGLATTRMRAVATSLLLFIQTIIGLGLGPLAVGYLSDRLAPATGSDSLRYALVLIGLVNLWAAAHYFLSARTIRRDLAATERAVAAEQGLQSAGSG